MRAAMQMSALLLASGVTNGIPNSCGMPIGFPFVPRILNRPFLAFHVTERIGVRVLGTHLWEYDDVADALLFFDQQYINTVYANSKAARTR